MEVLGKLLGADMLNPLRGENSPVAKLTSEQSLEIIRRSLAGERNKTLAEDYGVSPATISKLVRGLRWNGLQGARRTQSRLEGTGNHLAKLTEAKVREIRTAREHGMPYRQLAEQYGVAPSSILAVIQGRTWKHVKQDD